MGNNIKYRSKTKEMTQSEEKSMILNLDAEKRQRMARGTPKKPSNDASDSEWEKLFLGFSKLSKADKNGFKSAVQKMNKDSWEFWTAPQSALDGHSRAESYTFPMNSKEFVRASMNFGKHRNGTKGRPDRSHAGIDIYGKGGESGKDGHEIKASTNGTVVNISNYVKNTKVVTVVNDDGSVINYSEISASVKVGDKITQGQTVGYTEKMYNDSMLHIEIYEGKPSDKKAAQKALNSKKGTDIVSTSNNGSDMNYVNGNKTNNQDFSRRGDLHDPSILGGLAHD